MNNNIEMQWKACASSCSEFPTSRGTFKGVIGVILDYIGLYKV